MLLLSLDTSTTVCSVALHQDGALLGCYELLAGRTSSSMLTTLLDNVVQHNGFTLSQIDAVVVAKGPGSYTGLRIGVSTAKGLCFALDKPLVTVNTLAAMAVQVQGFFPENHLLCPMIDARRMEVYCALYDAAGREVLPTSALIIDADSFGDWLDRGPVVFFGDGAAKCQSVLGNHSNAFFLPTLVQPSARTVGQLGSIAYAAGQVEDLATFEPFYLKDFVTTQPKNPVGA